MYPTGYDNKPYICKIRPAKEDEDPGLCASSYVNFRKILIPNMNIQSRLDLPSYLIS